jgi:hypothetical protein
MIKTLLFLCNSNIVTRPEILRTTTSLQMTAYTGIYFPNSLANCVITIRASSQWKWRRFFFRFSFPLDPRARGAGDATAPHRAPRPPVRNWLADRPNEKSSSHHMIRPLPDTPRSWVGAFKSGSPTAPCQLFFATWAYITLICTDCQGLWSPFLFTVRF